ncbi:MAG: hypothetical protein ACK5LC_14245 [Coprobacillaceae bacterium]
MITKDKVSNCILHAEMEINDTKFTFADELVVKHSGGNNIFLTITYDSLEQAKVVYEHLSKEGTVLLEPTKTFYSPMHTTLRDKFDIQWNIIVNPINNDG